MESRHRQARAILEFLERGPASVSDIRANVGAGMSPKKRTKIIFCIRGVEAEGLLKVRNGLCHITDDGRDFIEPTPNVRIFTKETANV